MTEHTPGPWKFELEPPDSPYGVVVIADHGIVTHAADARLIAAAPDLLDALRMARRFVLSVSHDDDGDEDQHPFSREAREVLVLIDDAIDKARGEET